MFVAFLDHRLVEDLLLEIASRQFDGGDAALGRQRVGVAAACQGFLACGGEAVTQFFPRIGAGALRQRAVQEFLRLWPLPLQAG